MKRGSGLFVPREGITLDHHFMLPPDGADFRFLAGEHTVSLFADLVGLKEKVLLFQIKLLVSETHAIEIGSGRTGVFFDWGADSKNYHAHTKKYHVDLTSKLNQ